MIASNAYVWKIWLKTTAKLSIYITSTTIIEMNLFLMLLIVEKQENLIIMQKAPLQMRLIQSRSRHSNFIILKKRMKMLHYYLEHTTLRNRFSADKRKYNKYESTTRCHKT